MAQIVISNTLTQSVVAHRRGTVARKATVKVPQVALEPSSEWSIEEEEDEEVDQVERRSLMLAMAANHELSRSHSHFD